MLPRFARFLKTGVKYFLFNLKFNFMTKKLETGHQTSLILAIFKMPFMHKLTQSMAENTYVRSKGKNIIKTKIDSNKSNTLLQSIQRLKVQFIIKLCKALNAIIHVGFPERQRDFTPWNAFISTNMDAITVSDEMEAGVAYSKLLVAKGSLEPLEGNVSVTADSEAGTLTFAHTAEEFAYGCNPTDVIYAAVLEQERKRSKLYKLMTRKEDMPVEVTLPTGWKMENVAVYVFALSENGRKASDSTYLEIG